MRSAALTLPEFIAAACKGSSGNDIITGGSGHAEAWYGVTDHTTTGDANKVGYINGYSESVSNAVANGSSMGIVLADTTNLSMLNNMA